MSSIYALDGEVKSYYVVDIYQHLEEGETADREDPDEPLKGFCFDTKQEAEEFRDFVNNNAEYIELLLLNEAQN